MLVKFLRVTQDKTERRDNTSASVRPACEKKDARSEGREVRCGRPEADCGNVAKEPGVDFQAMSSGSFSASGHFLCLCIKCSYKWPFSAYPVHCRDLFLAGDSE